MQVGTCPNVFENMSWPDSTPQQHTATILGIKLPHLILMSLGNWEVQSWGVLSSSHFKNTCLCVCVRACVHTDNLKVNLFPL